MGIFKKIKPDDISIVKHTANKSYTFQLSDYSASREKYNETIHVYGYEGEHRHARLANDLTKTFYRSEHEFLSGSTNPGMDLTTNNYPKRSIHDSIRHLYYGHNSIGWTHHPDKSFCVESSRNEFRELNNNVQVISIPQQMMGDKLYASTNYKLGLRIYSGSELGTSDYNLKIIRDDGFGNIYDERAGGLPDPISTFQQMTGSIVAKWGFNEFYPYHEYDHATTSPHFHHYDVFPWKFRDLSRYDTPTFGGMVFFDSASKHGTGIKLTGAVGTVGDTNRWSFVTAKTHDDIDFRKDEDFAISFWTHLPIDQADTTRYHNYILTKGTGDHWDFTANQRHIGKFPFDIVVYNQTVNVKEGFNWNFYKDAETGYAATTMSIRNSATHSYITSSYHANLSLSYFDVHMYQSSSYEHTDGQESLLTTNVGGPQNASASFYIGYDASNTVEFILTGSIANNITASVQFKLDQIGSGVTPAASCSNGTSSWIQLQSYDTVVRRYIVSASHMINGADTASGGYQAAQVTFATSAADLAGQLAAAITGSHGHGLGRFSCSRSPGDDGINNLNIYQVLAGANGNTPVVTGSNFDPNHGGFWIGDGDKPNFTGGSDSSLEHCVNTSDIIYVHTASGEPVGNSHYAAKEALTRVIVKHINNSSSHQNYYERLGAISASYSQDNHATQGGAILELHSQRSQSVLTYPYPAYYKEGHGANEFYFSNEHAPNISNIPAGYGVSSTFGSGSGGGGPHGSTCPSESQVLTITDKQNTTVNFYYTTASVEHTQLTYPTISLWGGITASAELIASASANVINKSVEYAWTASENTFPLLISASYTSYQHPGVFGADIVLSSSIAGHNNSVLETLKRRAIAISTKDNVNANTGNIFANYFQDFQVHNFLTGATGPEYYADNFTQSWFVLTTRGPHFAGPSVPYTDRTGSYERHLFWYTRSGSAEYAVQPQLGLFTTHSATKIDLAETQSRIYGAGLFAPNTTAITFMSGAFDYLRVLSMSMEAVDQHPSFSLSMSGFPNAATENIINGAYGISPTNLNITPPGGVVNTGDRAWASSSWFVQPNTTLVPSNTNTGFSASVHDHGNPPAMQSASGENSLAVGPLFSSSAISYVGFDATSAPNIIEMTQTDGIIGISGQILARRNDGSQTYAVSSSTLCTGSWFHVLYQKSSSADDSRLELYINGILECSRSQIDIGDCRNKNDYYIGVAARQTRSGKFMHASDGAYIVNPNTGNPAREMVTEYMSPVSGAFDEFQIHNRALEQDEINFLYHLPNGTPYIGNVMYEHGLITITHPSSAYENIAKHCTLSFKNTHEITENEYSLNIKRGEYNFTMNPSIIEKTATGSRDRKIASYVTDTDWHPYITTVGLYNNEGQLLVIGKLSKPLKKDKGFDTTIVVQFDT